MDFRTIFEQVPEGIPTLSSSTPSTKMLVLESLRVLKEINRTINLILSQMIKLARGLKEAKLENRFSLFRVQNFIFKIF